MRPLPADGSLFDQIVFHLDRLFRDQDWREQPIQTFPLDVLINYLRDCGFLRTDIQDVLERLLKGVPSESHGHRVAWLQGSLFYPENGIRVHYDHWQAFLAEWKRKAEVQPQPAIEPEHQPVDSLRALKDFANDNLMLDGVEQKILLAACNDARNCKRAALKDILKLTGGTEVSFNNSVKGAVYRVNKKLRDDGPPYHLKFAKKGLQLYDGHANPVPERRKRRSSKRS